MKVFNFQFKINFMLSKQNRKPLQNVNNMLDCRIQFESLAKTL